MTCDRYGYGYGSCCGADYLVVIGTKADATTIVLYLDPEDGSEAGRIDPAAFRADRQFRGSPGGYSWFTDDDSYEAVHRYGPAFTFDQGFPFGLGRNVQVMEPLPDGGVVIGGSTGIVRVVEADATTVRWEVTRGTAPIARLYADQAGGVWVGSSGNLWRLSLTDGSILSGPHVTTSTVQDVRADGWILVQPSGSLEIRDASFVLQSSFSSPGGARFARGGDDLYNAATGGGFTGVRRLTSSGSVIWQATARGGYRGIGVDDEDNVYAGQDVFGSSDYLTKYDPTGVEVWHKTPADYGLISLRWSEADFSIVHTDGRTGTFG